MDSMIALVVLSISLLALVQLMGTALNQSAFSQNNTMAAAVVQEKIEELRPRHAINTASTAKALRICAVC